MDSLLLIIFVVGLLVFLIALVVLRSDASRLRRERERHDTSHVQQLGDTPPTIHLRTAAPPEILEPARLWPDPRIVIGDIQIAESPTSQSTRPAVDTTRINFSSTTPPAQDQPPAWPTQPISFGAVSAIARKCPICNKQVETTEAMMECRDCRTCFHANPCWEEHIKDRPRPCPICGSAQVHQQPVG